MEEGVTSSGPEEVRIHSAVDAVEGSGMRWNAVECNGMETCEKRVTKKWRSR